MKSSADYRFLAGVSFLAFLLELYIIYRYGNTGTHEFYLQIVLGIGLLFLAIRYLIIAIKMTRLNRKNRSNAIDAHNQHPLSRTLK
jgi:hypothetical protein